MKKDKAAEISKRETPLGNTYIVNIASEVTLSLRDEGQYTNLDNEGTYYYGCNQDLMRYVLGQLGYSNQETDKLLRACYRFEAKLARCVLDEAMYSNMVGGTKNA